MKAEIVNCFVEALETTLSKNGGFVLLHTHKKVLDYINVNDRVGIIIYLFGGSTIHGTIVITMDHEIAYSIIGSMIGGSKVNEIDSIGISALGEYTNWIVASAANKVQTFGEKITNFKVDIEANSYKNGKAKIYSEGNRPFLSLGYLIDTHEIEMSIDIS